MTIRIGVGSTNPVKLGAVQDAFEACFPGEQIHLHGANVPSGVSDQPMTFDETFLGARNRAKGAWRLLPSNDFWVGMEGGVHLIGRKPFECGRICVIKRGLDPAIDLSEAGTLDFPLGESTYELLKQGLDLNVVMEKLTGEAELGSQRGFYGYVTNDLISRQAAYTQAVIVAVTFFLHPELHQP